MIKKRREREKGGGERERGGRGRRQEMMKDSEETRGLGTSVEVLQGLCTLLGTGDVFLEDAGPKEFHLRD